MARSNVKITVKTPQKTYKVKDYAAKNHIFYEEVENNIARVTLNKLSESLEAANNQILSIVSTFFQRVVSRTPLDEDYIYGEKDGEPLWHYADKNQCRYDWIISIDDAQLTSGDIKDSLGAEVFYNVNNQDSINKIKEYISNFFGEDTDYSKVEIWNINPHFDVLEYGGYHNQKNEEGDWDDNNWSKKTKSKKGDLYEHGVENYHSVQAPVGMLRITEAELLRSSNSNAKSALSNRFKGQKYQRAKTPSDYMLKQLIKQMKTNRINIRDIKRYLGQR